MDTQMHGIWKHWMRVWIAATLGFGAVLVLAAIPAADGLARIYEDGIGMFHANAATYALPETRALNGLCGALTIGWGLTLAVAMRTAGIAGAPLWRGITLAFLVWFCIDSSVSIGSGFWLNAVSNTVFLAGFLAPVLATGVLRPAEGTQGRGASGWTARKPRGAQAHGPSSAQAQGQ